MLDIETLGTGDNAAIVQIGAVLFDPLGVPEIVNANYVGGVISAPGTGYRANVNVRQQVSEGLCDWDTIAWWMTKTTDEARRRVFAGDRVNLYDALQGLTKFLGSWGQPAAYVWSDVDFDIRLLRQAYNRMGLDCPFSANSSPFRGLRDYRTIRAVGTVLGMAPPMFVGTPHDALDDAYHQATHTAAILRRLAGL